MHWARVIPLAVAAGCFEDTGSGAGGPSDGSSGSTLGTGMDTTLGTTASAGTTLSTDTSVDATVAGELGPQLVSSAPVDGDGQASVAPTFTLYFDRVVSVADAEGKILVRQNGAMPTAITPIPCPPDEDPTCIGGSFPTELHDPATGRLPGGTPHEIVVSADFPDPDGLVNAMDQSVAFTTFEYEAEWYDDSTAIPDEVGGMVYEPAIEALFLVGPDATGSNTIVRKIPLAGGVAQPATTVAEVLAPPGGPLAYGMFTLMDELWVPMTYAGDVRRFNNLDAMTLDQVTFGGSTLAPPYDVLQDVWSIGRTPTRLFMSFGSFLGGERTGIVELTAGTWSIFEGGETLWGVNDCVITTGWVGGTERLFALGDQKIFELSLLDRTLVGLFPLADTIATADASLVIDPSGRLWLGSAGGLWAFAAGMDDLPLLAERGGVAAGRFALREAGDIVHAYFVDFRGPARVGHVAIGF